MTDLVVIFRTHSDIEAQIVRGLLETHGVISVVSSDLPHAHRVFDAIQLFRDRKDIAEGTKARAVYGKAEIRERHRHRYEFNMKYRAQMEAAGFVISGTSPDGALVEMIELRDHPYYLACQFHPEFQSKPNSPHPLFKGFVTACLGHGS